MKWKTRISVAGALLMACTAVPTLAQTTAHLEVSAALVPAACRPMLANGGAFDYRTLSVGSLNRTAPTPLPKLGTTLTIHCDADAKVAFKIVDGRTGTAADLGVPAEAAYGLGTIDDGRTHARIGLYQIWIDTPMLGGRSASLFTSLDSAVSWQGPYQPRSADAAALILKNKLYTFGMKNEPSAGSDFSANLQVQAIIDASDKLPLSQPATLNGQATISLTYI